MEMVSVKSSNVKAVGFEDNKLFVEYPGGTYVYEGVDKALYEKLLSAVSVGHFMNEEIKGRFNYSKIK